MLVNQDLSCHEGRDAVPLVTTDQITAEGLRGVVKCCITWLAFWCMGV